MINAVTLSTEPLFTASAVSELTACCKSWCCDKNLRTKLTATCGDIMSHSPSVAIMTNSVMGVIISECTSGSAINNLPSAFPPVKESSPLNSMSPKARDTARMPFTLLFSTVPPAWRIRSRSTSLSKRCILFSTTARPPLLSTHMESPTPATVNRCFLPSYTAMMPVEPETSSSSRNILHSCLSIVLQTSAMTESSCLRSRNLGCITIMAGRC
mmetsp:Transcript_9981/g.13726  ORF Transcript_9981/g.13726 Transcript_9981/m.13726 type:complete len:213 (-) Transcript_9981:3624-4262(-)